jgi:hypothetical protein
MSASTRSNGYDWRLKLLTVTVCSACSAQTDSLRPTTISACTVIGGFDSIGGLQAKFSKTETTAFEDAMTHYVLGSAEYGPVTGSGTYDSPSEASQKALFGELFHEAASAMAARPTRRWFRATDSVNKRMHTFTGRITGGGVNAIGAKGKASFDIEITLDYAPHVCTSA